MTLEFISIAEHQRVKDELREAQAEVARLKSALTDIQNVGSRHSDEMVAVGFCVMCAKMALESAAVPALGLLSEDVSREGEAL